MSRACVLLADGLEEIEAVTIIDVLRRAEVDVVTLGVNDGRAIGAHDLVIEADQSLDESLQEPDGPWDMVILPGGMPGATNLRDDPRVQALIRAQNEAGRPLAAICAAPIALGSAGALEGRRATWYPGFEDGLTGATLSEDRVVVDGHVTTSRGPGTALEFSLALVERLCGAETAQALREGMLVAS